MAGLTLNAFFFSGREFFLENHLADFSGAGAGQSFPRKFDDAGEGTSVINRRKIFKPFISEKREFSSIAPASSFRLASAGLVLTVAIDRESATGLAAASVLRSMVEGLKFIVSHAGLSFVIVSMTSGMFAVRCFGSLISIYVRDILHGDAALFGALNALIGVGMIGGSLFLPLLTRRASAQHLVAYGLAGMGAAVFMTAMFATVAPAAASMLGVGFFAAFVMVCAQTLIQQETPQELLGRVSSTLMSLLAIAQVLALFGAGPFAESAGVLNLYFLSAAALVAIGGLGYWKLQSTKRAEAAQ